MKKKKIKEIKKKITQKTENDKFGNKKITFSIENSKSYFKFIYNSFIYTIEKIKYKISKDEELYIFIKELKNLMRKIEIRYIECFISAYKPIHQKMFYNEGFKPRGYVPCWKYDKKKDFFEDHIVFNYFKGNIDKNIKLIPESRDLLQTLNFFKEKFIPKFLELINI